MKYVLAKDTQIRSPQWNVNASPFVPKGTTASANDNTVARSESQLLSPIPDPTVLVLLEAQKLLGDHNGTRVAFDVSIYYITIIYEHI
jgi:hypothetical protein